MYSLLVTVSIGIGENAELSMIVAEFGGGVRGFYACSCA